MRQKFVIFLMGLFSIVAMSPVYAHLNANHSMGLVDGLRHLFTEPSHIVLLLPAIIVALILIVRRLNMRKSD